MKISQTQATIITALITAVVGGIFAVLAAQRPIELQIKATETAEARPQISTLSSNTIDPNLALTFVPVVSPTYEQMPTSTISFNSSIPVAGDIEGPSDLPVGLYFTVDNQSVPSNGYVLPDNIQPKLSSAENKVLDAMHNAWMGLDYYEWYIAPGIYPAWSAAAGEMDNELPVSFQVYAPSSNAEWVIINNTLRLSITKDYVLENVQLVHMEEPGTSIVRSTEAAPTPLTPFPTGPIIPVTGGITWRLASVKINLDNDEKNSNFLLVFPDADIYSLKPGEIEFFQFTVVCKSPGTYELIWELPYTYSGKSGLIKPLTSSHVICPNKATYWKWWYGFYSVEEYSWDGENYIPK